MSGWKLVEAEMDEPEVQEQTSNTNNRFQKGNATGGRGGRGDHGGRGNQTGRGGRGGGTGGGRGGYKNPYISKQDRNYRSYMAVQLIEMILSPDNLCMDTYIRSYMDEAGYVPIALVYSYPNVAAFGALYGDLKYRLKQLGEESCIEIDTVNDLIRTKNNWEMWLMPNQTGGRGQPKYVKQTSSKQFGSGNNYYNDTDQQGDGNYCEDGNMEGYEGVGQGDGLAAEGSESQSGSSNTKAGDVTTAAI
jgi:hypothetical protein